MKRLTLTLLVANISLLAAYVVSSAQGSADQKKQAKPDLSGQWVLDTRKSTVEGRGEAKITDYVMTIVHKEPEIKITARFRQGGREVATENHYYTDGRRASFRDPDVTTRWRGTKLVIVSSFRAPINKVIVPDGIVTTVEWELSPDGKTLTRTTRNSGLIVGKTRSVFNRSS